MSRILLKKNRWAKKECRTPIQTTNNPHEWRSIQDEALFLPTSGAGQIEEDPFRRNMCDQQELQKVLSGLYRADLKDCFIYFMKLIPFPQKQLPLGLQSISFFDLVPGIFLCCFFQFLINPVYSPLSSSRAISPEPIIPIRIDIPALSETCLWSNNSKS